MQIPLVNHRIVFYLNLLVHYNANTMLLVEKNKNEAGAHSTCKALISRFIRIIWNHGRLDRLENFLHEDFIDYSIPVKSLQNRTGTRLHLKKLGSIFSHKTIVNSIIECEDLVICDFTLHWRHDKTEGSFSGLRIFRLKSGKILHHWEVIY